jgi:hypothetical protein
MIIHACCIYILLRKTESNITAVVLYSLICTSLNLQFMIVNFLFLIFLFYLKEYDWVPASIIMMIKPIYIALIIPIYLYRLAKKEKVYKSFIFCLIFTGLFYVLLFPFWDRLLFGHFSTRQINLDVILSLPSLFLIVFLTTGSPAILPTLLFYIPLLFLAIFKVNRYLWAILLPVIVYFANSKKESWFRNIKNTSRASSYFFVLMAIFSCVFIFYTIDIMDNWNENSPMMYDMINLMPIESYQTVAGNFWEAALLGKYLPAQHIPPTEFFYAHQFQGDNFVNETAAYLNRLKPDIILISPVETPEAKNILPLLTDYTGVIIPFPFDHGYRIYLSRNETQASDFKTSLRIYFSRLDLCSFSTEFQSIINFSLGIWEDCTFSTF